MSAPPWILILEAGLEKTQAIAMRLEANLTIWLDRNVGQTA